MYDRSGSPLFRTDTKQSWPQTGWYPPVEGFLSLAKVIESDLAEAVTATIHPSAILRGEPERREAELAAFVDDLRFAASLS